MIRGNAFIRRFQKALGMLARVKFPTPAKTALALAFLAIATVPASTGKPNPGDFRDEASPRVKALELQRNELEERVKTLEVQLKELEIKSNGVEPRLERLEKMLNGKDGETLELRVKNLERLNGSDITLGVGNSSIHITPVGVTIESNDITVKASGVLTLKGARTISN